MDMYRENPIYGRKVFFLNPPFAIEKKVIEWLKAAEYEVYILRDVSYAKSILKGFPNAICFINIDELLTLKGWYNFIKSFETEPGLESIFLGITATKTPEASVNKFIMNVRLPGGYIQTGSNKAPEENFQRFIGILELNGAKGQRKYLSMTCTNVDALTGYIAYESKLYSMSFENISSIGITCKLPAELANSLKKNTLLDNVSLSLGRWSVITQCLVYSLRKFNDDVIAILLFTKNTSTETRESIRKFIYDVLNKRIELIIKNSPQDFVDYNTSQTASADGIADYNAPNENDTNSVDGVDDLENVEQEASTEKTDSSETKTEEKSETETAKSETPEEPAKEETEETKVDSSEAAKSEEEQE